MGLAKKANITAVISDAEVDAMPSVIEARAEDGHYARVVAATLEPKGDESTTNAALARLKAARLPKNLSQESVESMNRLVNGTPKAQYKQRDFDAEARGKTRCVQYEAALMSPAIAGMQFNTMEEYLKLVKQAADAGVAYTFGE